MPSTTIVNNQQSIINFIVVVLQENWSADVPQHQPDWGMLAIFDSDLSWQYVFSFAHDTYISSHDTYIREGCGKSKWKFKIADIYIFE